MAGTTEHGTETASADMKEHLRTWNGFLTFIKWQLIGIFALLALLLIFRTNG